MQGKHSEKKKKALGNIAYILMERYRNEGFTF